MKIPLITLAEKVFFESEHAVDLKKIKIESNWFVEGIRFVTADQKIWKDNFLYIQASDRVEKSTIFLFRLENQTVYQKEIQNGKYTSEEYFNQTLEVLEQYQKWIVQIQEMFYRHQSLQNMIAYFSEMLGNPVYLVDASYKVIAIDDRPMYSEISAIWRHLTEYRYLSYDIITKMREYRELEILDQQERAQLFQSKVFPNAFINRNVTCNGEIVGHLFVVGYCKRITQGDIAWAEQLGKLIEEVLKNDLTFFSLRGRDYENFLIHMLEGKLQDSILIKRQLAILNWKIHQNYFLAVVLPEFMEEVFMEGICRSVEKIPDAKPVIYHKEIVVFFTWKTEDEHADRSEQLFRLAYHEKCMIGISDNFSDFQNVSKYYQQAHFVMNFIMQNRSLIDKRRKVYTYSETAVFQLFHAAEKNMELSLILDPSINVLAEYDRRHQTDYLQTLYVFLKNERNIAMTAKELFIHRNTLLYRIERLKKMVASDIDDPRERMRLLLSFELKDYLIQQTVEEEE